MISEGFLFLPFVTRTRHKGLRTVFADALQTRRVIVVGYYNVDVKAGKFSMVALNIDPMNEGKTYTLDELFPVGANSTPYGTAGGADQIQTWDHANQTYRYFYLYKKTVGTGKEKNNKWVENVEGQPLATINLKAGDSVFFYSQKDQTLFVPGQVPNEAAGVLKQGFNMVSAGFPTKWNPNDAGTSYWGDTTKFTPYGTAGGADQIQYWDKENQTYRYFYLYKKTVGTGKEKNNKWVENVEGQPLLETDLDVSEGFFFYKQKAGEIEFKPGLKL